MTVAYLNTLQTKDHEMIPAGGICMFGAVQGSAGYCWGYWTAIGRSNRLFYSYTQTEHVSLKQNEASKCTAQIFSGWIVASHHSLQYLVHGHLLCS